MAQRIQLRRGTAAEWAAANPVLAVGEPGVETDTGKQKFGNGTSTWTALPYASKGDPGPAGVADDASVKTLITTPGSQTAGALNATFVQAMPGLELVPATAYGHSFVAGGYVGESSNSWPWKVASRLRTKPLVNLGVGGTRTTGIADKVLSTWTVGTQGLVMMMCLTNDARVIGSSTNAELASYEHVRAALAYLTAGAAYNASTASCFTYSGTWTAGPTTAQGGASKQTSQVGASVEVAFNGDSCYLLTRTETGACSVQITDSGTGAIQTTTLGPFVDEGAKVIKLSGYGAGAHTVRVTVVTATSPFVINAVLIPSPNPPTIVLVREGPATAYPNGQDPVTTNSWLMNRFVPALDPLAGEFPTLALTSKLGPTGWNATTMSGPDGLHPSDAGTDCIASTAIAALRNAGAAGFRQGQNIGTTTAFTDTVATPAFVGVPAQVNNVQTTFASGQVTLSWSAPSQTGGSTISDYRVQYRQTGSGTWTTWAHTASSATTSTVTGLSNGTSYDFQVAAVNASGVGAYSAMVSTVPGTGTVPAQVTALTAVPDMAGAALSWTAPNNGGLAISDYSIQYRVAGSGSWSTFAHAAQTGTSITVTGLAVGTSYDFQVAAVNGNGTGTYSAMATTTTYRAADTFNRADTTAAQGLGSTSFGALAWTAPAQPQFFINSNAAKGTSGLTDAVTYVNAGASDATVQATLTTVGDAGIVGRVSDQSNFFLLRGNGNYTLYKKVAGGAYTTLLSLGTSVAGDVMKLVFSGSSVSVVVNGVTLGTVTDTFNQTATGFGFRQGNGTAGGFDNFSVL